VAQGTPRGGARCGSARLLNEFEKPQQEPCQRFTQARSGLNTARHKQVMSKPCPGTHNRARARFKNVVQDIGGGARQPAYAVPIKCRMRVPAARAPQMLGTRGTLRAATAAQRACPKHAQSLRAQVVFSSAAPAPPGCARRPGGWGSKKQEPRLCQECSAAPAALHRGGARRPPGGRPYFGPQKVYQSAAQPTRWGGDDPLPRVRHGAALSETHAEAPDVVLVAACARPQWRARVCKAKKPATRPRGGPRAEPRGRPRRAQKKWGYTQQLPDAAIGACPCCSKQGSAGSLVRLSRPLHAHTAQRPSYSAARKAPLLHHRVHYGPTRQADSSHAQKPARVACPARSKPRKPCPAPAARFPSRAAPLALSL